MARSYQRHKEMRDSYVAEIFETFILSHELQGDATCQQSKLFLFIVIQFLIKKSDVCDASNRITEEKHNFLTK